MGEYKPPDTRDGDEYLEYDGMPWGSGGDAGSGPDKIEPPVGGQAGAPNKEYRTRIIYPPEVSEQGTEEEFRTF